jgi:hypothetical protein
MGCEMGLSKNRKGLLLFVVAFRKVDGWMGFFFLEEAMRNQGRL